MKNLLVSVFVIFLAACGSNMPIPSISEYIQTEGGGFLIERNAGVKYAMTYTLLPPGQSVTSYKAVFESTLPNGQPVTSEGTIEPGTSELMVQSPVIPGVKNNHTYTVTLVLSTNDEQLTSHQDQVRFSMPSSVLANFEVTEY